MDKLNGVLFKTVFFFTTIIFLFNLQASPSKVEKQRLTIGFGSCADQDRKQVIWDSIAAHNPDLFIMMGDNVYIDSADPLVMEESYSLLSNDPHFSKFRENTDLMGVWDDHDYGSNDGGRDFSGKQVAKAAFLEFFNYPELEQAKQSGRGIYHTRWLELNDKKIQIILLDTRWYRDPIVKSYLSKQQRKLLNLGPYQPTIDQSTRLLGESQWLWLEEEMKKPADLTLLVSSIQVLGEFSGWETWANFPHERQRLLELLHQYEENKLLILSGDIHKAEISELNFAGKRLVEITSSPLAATTYPASVNKHRTGTVVEDLNFGLLTIEDNGSLSIVASIYDFEGKQRLSVSFNGVVND